MRVLQRTDRWGKWYRARRCPRLRAASDANLDLPGAVLVALAARSPAEWTVAASSGVFRTVILYCEILMTLTHGPVTA